MIIQEIIPKKKACAFFSLHVILTDMKKIPKTNAMRILDQAKIAYRIQSYEIDKPDHDYGLSVAKLLHQDPSRVFKTLITQTADHHIYVFALPVLCELDLKKGARAVNEKSLTLVPVKEIFSLSGYVRGGCSIIGMKKNYPTVFHDSALSYDTVFFSGGKIGIQLEANPQELISLLNATSADIIRLKRSKD